MKKKNPFQSVLDHENFIMNITEANITNKPVWKKEYSAKVMFVWLVVHLECCHFNPLGVVIAYENISFSIEYHMIWFYFIHRCVRYKGN